MLDQEREKKDNKQNNRKPILVISTMKHSDLIICITQILWFSEPGFGHFSHVKLQTEGKE